LELIVHRKLSFHVAKNIYAKIESFSMFSDILRKFQTDMDSNLATADARGENKKAFEVARNALRKKMTVEDIIDLTGLTREEIEGLSG